MGENLKSLLLWIVGIEPTTQKTHGRSTTPFVKVIRGVLVRLTTCKRLTNSLPKLSLITLPPPETAGYQVGRIYGRTCQLSKKLMTKKNEELSGSGGGLEVNWPRPRLEIRLRYVGFP